MSDQKSQGGSRDARGNEPGGYVAIYHDIEEISYGPLCGLPAIARVFLCIRHKLLRDGLGQKAIGHTFVIDKTGLTKKQVISAVNKLAKSGLIIIKADYIETARGKLQYYENKYELNPVVFGEEYNWYKNNPTVRVYSGEKVGSYSRKGVSPSGVKSDTRGGPKSDTRVVPDLIPRGDPRLAKLYEKIASNNPSSNNPSSNNPISKELNSSEKGTTNQRTQSEHERIVREQLALAKEGRL